VLLMLVLRSSRALLPDSRTTFASRVVIYTLAFFLAIETSSAIHYVLRAFDPLTQVGRIDAGVELQFSYAAYGLTPWLYLLFLFSWAWIPIVSVWLTKTKVFSPYSLSAELKHQEVPPQSPRFKSLSTLWDPGLLIALAGAVFVGYYPYFHNPPWLVGTDAYWRYFDPLQEMNTGDGVGAFLQALRQRHPLPLSFFYLLQIVFHASAFEVVRLAPLLLTVAFAISSWWFLAKNKRGNLGLIVLSLAVLSVSTAVGMYASVLANWMALVVWVLFFAYVGARADKGFRLLDAILLLGLSNLVLFIHPWTWPFFAASVVLFSLGTMFWEKRRGPRVGLMLTSIITIGAVVAVLSLSILGGSQGWRVAEALALYTSALREPTRLLVFWQALTRLTQVWAAFLHPICLAMSVLGVFYLHAGALTMSRRRLILAWICASSIGSILAAPIGFNPDQPLRSESQLWRVLFLTPFQLAAPFGVEMIVMSSRRLCVGNGMAPSLESDSSRVREAWLAAVLGIAVLLAWAPIEWRSLLILAALPLCTMLALRRSGGQEKEFVTAIVLAVCLLVFCNYAMRALAQLLIDPHNYRSL